MKGQDDVPLQPGPLLRQNSGYSLQHSQVLQMKYLPTRTSSVTGSSPSISVGSLPASYLSQLPSNWQAFPPPHQQQIIQQLVSRNSASPHHRARMAAALARNTPGGLGTAHANPVSSSSAKADGGSVNLSASSINNEKDAAAAADGSGAAGNAHLAGNWTAMDLGGMGVRNISQELYNFSFLTSLYLNHNNLTAVSTEIGKLKHLGILDLSGNQLKSLPAELGQLTNLKELLIFDNLLTTVPFELGSLYQLDFLGLEGNRITEPILSLYQKHGTLEVISHLRDNSTVIQPPADREWLTIETQQVGGESFTTMTYNILNDKYATQQAYGYTPSWALTWDYRKELILQEILSYNADLICLQEVETCQFDEYFKAELGKLSDYDGVFFAKSRSKTMSERDKKNVDGCAIFYRKSKFQMLEVHNLEFNQLCISRPDFRKTDDMYNRVMTKDNVAIIARLETKEPLEALNGEKGTLLVGNVHIHWDPMHKDVKLVQSAILLEELEKHYRNYPNASIVLCGDFNSMPGSGVYDFINQGSLVADHEDFGPHSYEPYTSHGLKHLLPLKSVYSSTIGELNFTNYTPSFSGVIDYIWFSHGSLAVQNVLGAVPKEYTDKVVGFPNAHFPSDHISLLTEFKWRSGGSGSGSSNSGQNSGFAFMGGGKNGAGVNNNNNNNKNRRR